MTEYFTKDGDNYVKVEEELLTSEQIGSIVSGRAERIAHQKYPDYSDLKEQVKKLDVVKSEYEDKLKVAGDEKSAVEKERDNAKLEVVKVKVAHEFKLSDDLSEFLNGTDEKTIRDQAEKLSKGVKGSSVQINKEQKPDEKTSDTKKIAKGLFGNKSGD